MPTVRSMVGHRVMPTFTGLRLFMFHALKKLPFLVSDPEFWKLGSVKKFIENDTYIIRITKARISNN